jgi:carbon monoxide dehydrogenase subunit G
MRQFNISIDVSAPPARVWEVMSDIERWHEWTPSVTSIALRGGGPLTVGSRAMIRQPKFPPAMWKVTAIEPGRSFTWVSVGPGIRVVARHSVEPAGANARATLSLELQGIFGGVFGRLTKDITERYLAFEAAGLRARSEDPAFRHGGTA